MHTHLDTPWDDTRLASLRQLWAEGCSTAEIGRRLGVSKNAVIGKVHRLKLDTRPSPLGQKNTPKRPGSNMDAQNPAATPPSFPKMTAPPPEVAAGPTADTPATDVHLLPIRRASLPACPASGRSCCWPMGEPGTAPFRFCDRVAVPGRPYCAEHARVAYKPRSETRPHAAG